MKKNSWSKRLLSMILALCMLCSVMPVMAEGEESAAIGSKTNPITKDNGGFSKLQELIAGATGGTENDPTEIYISGMLDANSPVEILANQHIKLIGVGKNENGLQRISTFPVSGGDIIEVGNAKDDVVASLVMENIVLDGGAVWQDGDNKGIEPGNSSLLSVRALTTATLTDCVLRNNEKGGGGSLVWLIGELNLIDCTVTGNATTGTNNGGAVYMKDSKAKLTATGSTFSNNYAGGDGGAVYAYNSSIKGVTLTNCTFKNNEAATGKSGGAVYSKGSTTISGGTFSGNVAGNSGGAIYQNGGSLSIAGATITGNTARATGNGNGGGVYIKSVAAKIGSDVQVTGNFRVESTTNNVYLDSGASLALQSAPTKNIGVTPVSTGTIATISSGAANVLKNEKLTLDFDGGDNGLYASNDTTIVYGLIPPTITLSSTEENYAIGEEVTVTLTAKQDGAALYYKLDDAAEWTAYAAPFTVTADSAKTVKVSAYAKIDENTQTAAAETSVVFADSVYAAFDALEAAIKAAPTTGVSADSPTVLYVKGMIEAPRKLYLVGGQHIKLVGIGDDESGLKRSQNYTGGGDMIDVGNDTADAACSLELEDFILDGGAVWADGAGSTNSGIKAGNSSLMSIRDAASVVLGEGAVLRNNEKSGTGAAFYSKGKLEIAGGEISDNYSNGGDGGAIYMNANNAVTTMSSGKICGNAASDDKSGGAIRVKGTFKMTGGEISGNSAGNSGGAIYLSGTPAALELTGGKITGNIARATDNGSGGAIHMNNNGQVIKVGGSVEITGNKCKTAENNIYLSDTDRTITLTSTLTGKVGVTAVVGTTVAKKSGNADLEASLDNFKLDTADSNLELAVSGDSIILQAKQLTPFEQLELAIKQAAGTPENPVVIEISGMIEAPRRLVLNDGQHIKLVGVGEGENGLIRSKTYDSGDMIDVGVSDSNVASLVLENIVMDGGKNVGAPALNSSLLSVRGKSTLTLGEGTILRNNVKSGGGSGVWIVGTLIVDGGKIVDNETTGDYNGGGVYLRNPGSVLIMKAGEISGNKAGGSSGGGVQVNDQGTVQLADGKITGNTAAGKTNNISVLDGKVEIIGAPAEGDVFGLTLKSAEEGSVAAVRGTGASDATLQAAAKALSLDGAAVLGFAVDGDNIVVADTTTGCGCVDGFVKGNGSAEAPYQITTAALLAHMAEHEGSSFKLMNNVEVSDWAPVDLDGNFNGNDCTISGLTDSLFASVSADSKIYDLTIGGAITVGKDTMKTGALAAESAGEIENVTSTVDITIPATADKDAMIGGLIGLSSGTVTDSTYSGKITDARANSGSYVGEIVGCSAYKKPDGLPTMVTAHAGFAAPGGAGDTSEDNTLDNMIKAINLGPDAIEVDVQKGSDGALWLGHDGVNPEKNPTLEDALKLLMGQHKRSNELNENGATVRIQLDSKQDGNLDEILALIKEIGFPVNRIILAGDNSYDHVKDNIDAIRAAVNEGMDFWMNPNFILSYDAMANNMDAFLARIEALDLPKFTVNSSYGDISDTIKARFDEEGINVSVWTLNSSSAINSQITRGMYNTTSRLLECLETRNLLRDGVLGNTYGEDWPQIGSYVPNGVNLYVVDFDIPAGAAIVVTDESGNAVAANPDGSYTLEEGETYTYTVTKSGYKSQSGTVTEANEDETITVTLQKKSSSSSTTSSAADKAVSKAENLIDEIGKVTLKDQEAIEKAREAYDDLTAAQKRNVDNYDELVAAEKKLAELLAAEEIELPFTDVDEDDTCYEAVKFMYENGLMVGVGDGTTFAPEMGLSRAMIAQILHMYEEQPDAVVSNFSDVARGFWYTDAIDWATAAGVISGYGNGSFGPNDTLTREQLAVMLYQYAISRGWDIDCGSSLEHPDRHTVSHWAVDAMQWAINNGLLTENGVGYLAASDPATRADVAQAFMALVNLYA